MRLSMLFRPVLPPLPPFRRCRTAAAFLLVCCVAGLHADAAAAIVHAPQSSNARAAAKTAKTQKTETWYGVFLSGKRAGYLMREASPETWSGKPAERTRLEMRLD